MAEPEVELHGFDQATPEVLALLAEAEAVLGTTGVPTGSRAVSPLYARADSDFDWVFYIPSCHKEPEPRVPEEFEEFDNWLEQHRKWEKEAVDTQLAISGWSYTAIYTRNGGSFTKEAAGHKVNLIVVTDKEEYDKWLVATEVGKKLNPSTREERIKLFRGIIGA